MWMRVDLGKALKDCMASPYMDDAEPSEWQDSADAFADVLLEMLAMEADEVAKENWYYFGYDEVPQWIRSKKVLP